MKYLFLLMILTGCCPDLKEVTPDKMEECFKLKGSIEFRINEDSYGRYNHTCIIQKDAR